MDVRAHAGRRTFAAYHGCINMGSDTSSVAKYLVNIDHKIVSDNSAAEGRDMSGAIELPPGDIEHIRLMYRDMAVVLSKAEYDDMLDTVAKDSRRMRQRMLDHVTRELERVYPLIIGGKATEEMHHNFVQDVAIVDAYCRLLLTRNGVRGRGATTGRNPARPAYAGCAERGPDARASSRREGTAARTAA
jgi:hypothetical protein